MATDVVKTAMTANKTYDVTGVAIWNWNAVRVAPRSPADIVEVCANDTYKCDANQFQKCSSGQWQAAQNCSEFNFAASESSNANASAYACNTTKDGCIITACLAGYKPNATGNACETDPNYCTTGVCSETEYKPCNTETHAYGTAESKPAAVENGSWNCDAASGWSLTCNPDYELNAAKNACVEIETCTSNKCEDNKYYTCTGGSYDAGTLAPGLVTGGQWNCEVATGWTLTCSDPYEKDTATACKLIDGKCVANSDCDGGKLCNTTNNVCEVCTAKCLDDDTPGGKSAVTTCDGEKKVFNSEFSCKSTTEIGVCKNNGSRCAADGSAALEKCVAGEWQADEACSERGVDHAETYECSDATCSVKTCETGYSVGSDKLSCEPVSASECTGTETKCEDTEAGAVVSTCNSGNWTAGTADSTVSCAGNVLGVCKNGAKQCATGETVGIQTCANGAWGEAVACSGIEGAATYSCDATTATCKVETCSDTNQEPNADKTACIDKTTPAEEWTDIVSITKTKSDDNLKCVGVSKQTGDYDYLNCGHFSASFDPNAQYIVYELQPNDIAKLSDKTQIAADFSVATQKKSVLKNVNYQFFNDTGAIGTAGSTALNGSTIVNVEKYAAEFTDSTGLQLRIWPNPDEAKGENSLVRLHTISIYAK